jgi:hypothetical protein
MARSSTKSKSTAPAAGKSDGGGEVQQHKSPAEFFADNQAIAGFDNLGMFERV